MNLRSISTPALVSAMCLLCSYDSPKNSEQGPEKNQDCDPYDVIIVPGVPYQDPMFRFILKARMLWAKHLYENNIAKNIIFSGSSVYSPYVESMVMRIYADSLGIPSANTFAETRAEHSTENVYYSLLMAKKLGFKKIAVATDGYQKLLISKFIKENFPEIDVITIDYDKIDVFNTPWPEIDPSPAYVGNFISIVKRENRIKRFKGTMGKNISADHSNSFASKGRDPFLSFSELNLFLNPLASGSYISSDYSKQFVGR